MANVRISALPAAADVVAADLVAIVDGGTTRKATIAQVVSAVSVVAANAVSIGNAASDQASIALARAIVASAAATSVKNEQSARVDSVLNITSIL